MVILNQFSLDQLDEVNQLISYIKNLLNNNHVIQQVFFYGPAVLQAHLSKSPKKILSQWQELSKYIPLTVCPNSAIKRGVYDLDLSQEYSVQVTLDKNFKIGSLAEFLTLLANQYPKKEISIVFENDLIKPSVELEEALDFTLFSASLDWRVKIIFYNLAINLFEQNKTYFTELFDLYDIDYSSIVFLKSAAQFNQLKLDNKLVVSF